VTAIQLTAGPEDAPAGHAMPWSMASPPELDRTRPARARTAIAGNPDAAGERRVRPSQYSAMVEVVEAMTTLLPTMRLITGVHGLNP
jgi:hypothetical protein